MKREGRADCRENMKMKSGVRVEVRREIGLVAAVAALVPLLLSGCGSADGSGADTSSETTTEEAQALAADRSVAAVRARTSEVQGYLERTYFSRLNVIATTQGPFGEVVDWVDPRSLDPDFDKRTPPPASVFAEAAPVARTTTSAAPAAVDAGDDLRALWAEAAKKAPAGTVPVVRQNFDHYVSGNSGKRSVEEFVESHTKPTPQAPFASPQPAGRNRLYTSKVHTTSTVGTQGWIQYVNPAQVPSTGAFSLTQLASLCWGSSGATTLEAIEVGLQKFPGMYGDSNLHFFTFFRTHGGDTGNFIGGYNLDVAGFVQQPGAFPPGAIVPNPPAGQAHQRRLRTTLFNGAWWVQDWVSSTSFTWLGYYPIGSGSGQIPFDLINTGACETHWYGEVFDSTPTSWHNGDLGNGILGPSAGSLAFLEMIIERSAGNIWFNGGGTATDPACYNMTNVQNNGTTNWFNFGGPGGDGAGCD